MRIQGKPFVEDDISAKLPSAKLIVQFKGPDIMLVCDVTIFSLLVNLPLLGRVVSFI